MARRTQDKWSTDDGVQDSFLDIVANIVGILILLVIVVGVRAALQPPEETSGTEPDSREILNSAMLTTKSQELYRAQQALIELQQGVASLEIEAARRDLERLDLATYVAAVEQQLNVEKAKLSNIETERLDVRSAIAEADLEWQQLMLQKVALASDAGRPQKIVHTPTPIVRNNSDKTMHLRLEGGRVAVVPFERLIELIDSRSLDSHRRDLQRQGGVGRLGPVDGFELHYALITRASAPGPAGARQLMTFVAGELRPAEAGIGEPVATAVGADSRLANALRLNNPRDTIVMVWVYSDSTSEFRTLQSELRKRGYSVDLRLLPEKAHISFSPEGRKTSAQ